MILLELTSICLLGSPLESVDDVSKRKQETDGEKRLEKNRV